ncbi:hypothetical protein [Polyangium spumosum]|uniref:Uncharacterized protein n=1 Tax=Polyangium spumosum TaxID=889282 RepID=A0A6N7PWH4_9BACT|nr:hypothetical protein [Polyangium spumosum]MRG94595.1 hypothetical protein [Polyangium spumosum]
MLVGLLSAASACFLGDYEPPSGQAGGGGPTPSAREVHCGDDVCGPSEICCIDQGDTPTSACTSPDACLALTVPCDDPDDCAHVGGICCGLWDEAAFVYTAVECTSSCDAVGHPLCRYARDDLDCPTGLDCKEERLFGPGFGYCDAP